MPNRTRLVWGVLLGGMLLGVGGCPSRRAPAPVAPVAPATIPALTVLDVVPDTAAYRDLPQEPDGGRAVEVYAPVYTVDRIYRSMTGPETSQEINLDDPARAELLWLTGYRAVMVAPDGTTPMAQDFMCHSNLDFDVAGRRARSPKSAVRDARLFTLSQGQLTVELPEGFGIPMKSDEWVQLNTQVLNLNEPDRTIRVRHRVTVEYVRDGERPGPIQPLYQVGVYGMKFLKGKDAYPRVAEGDAERHGPGCLPGTAVSHHQLSDKFGRTFTSHWVVKSGREENHTLVTKILNLPEDTLCHYIAVHLHPFAESMAFVDLTTGETVFSAKTRQMEGRIGLAHVDHFSSVEGIPLYKDHEYEVVSVYENTTDVDQDAMAVMYLYLLDTKFDVDAARK